MSGSTIGGIGGAVIGFAVTGGNPAGARWGWMIGSVVGGIIDPQVIQGSKWNNQTMQGSQDGLARAVVFGIGPVVGNLLDSEPKPRLGKRKERQGKGGPVVEHDTALLTYAIEICDSSALRGTAVGGVIAVWEDEKLVYDLRPGAQLSAADSAKWARNKKFYYGAEDQAPPPELEAIHGVGNVPGYRGTCLMTATDEDLMVDAKGNPRGRVPNYRFLVSACGVGTPPASVVPWLAITTGGTGGVLKPSPDGLDWTAALEPVPLSNGDPWAPNTTTTELIFAGNRVLGGTSSVTTGTHKVVVRNGTTWTGATTEVIAADGGQVFRTSTHYGLISGGAGNVQFSIDGATFVGAGYSYEAGCRFGSGALMTKGLTGAWNRIYVGTANADGTGHVRVEYITDHRASRTTIASDDSATAVMAVLDDQPDALGPTDLAVHVYTGAWQYMSRPFPTVAGQASAAPKVNVHYSAGLGRWFITWGNRIAHGLTPATIALDARVFPAEILGIGDDGTKVIICGRSGMLESWSPESGWQALAPGPGVSSTTIILDVVALGSVSNPTGLHAPDSPGYYVDPDGTVSGPALASALDCSVTLQYVVRTIHELGAPQLNDADFDLAPLAGDIVRGYVIQDANLTAADACEPLRKVWTFDLPSYDLKIRARKRGGALDWTLNPDDLVMGEESFDSSQRGQPVEYPKKLHVGYLDPSLDYKPTTQISERYSATVHVVGEEAFDSLLVLSADEAKQTAHKLHKMLWTELEDSRSVTAPIEYLKAVPADLLSYNGRRYRIDSMRVEGMRVVLESCAYDRASAYSSNATGTPGTAPPAPTGSVRGPTVSALMNLPVLRDADDRAGIYWAASGLLEAWAGAQLQLQRGEWENGPAVSLSATMGELTAPLPVASRYGLDNANTLSVKLTPTSGPLDSTTMDGLIAEANAAAILYGNGTAEIVQFQTATETAPREYQLTGLLRGRLDTVIAAHATGARFVLLDDAVRFVALRPDDIGKTLTFRAASLGTDPAANPTQTLAMTTLQSLVEWQPYAFEVTPAADGGYCASWIGRARLGSSRLPTHSQWFDGYRVTFQAANETHEVTTTAQSVCVTAQDLSKLSGTSPAITVVAQSRVATGDDDFNSAPSTNTTTITPPGSSGSLPDGYVGVPYSNVGAFGDPWVDRGNRYYRRVSGQFWPGATVSHRVKTLTEDDWIFDVCGHPLVAGTYSAVPRVDTGDGTYTDPQSVTIAPKPAFAVLDFSGRIAEGVGHTGVAPAFTGVQLSGGAILDCAGWTTGKVYCEFTVSALSVLYAGVHGAALTSKYVGGANTLAHGIIAAGTYALAFDTATGNLWVRNSGGWIGGGDPAAGTAPTLAGLTATVNGRFRFGFTGAATLQANFGNMAWAYAIPTGFTGVAMPAVEAPVIWDSQTLQADTRYVLSPLDGRSAALLRAIVSNAPEHRGNVRGTFGKASGQWQVGLINKREVDGFYVGLVESAYVPGVNDVPGAPGTGNSIGIRGVVAVPVAPYDQPHILIQTSFGGVHTEFIHPRDGTSVGEFTLAADLTAGTVAIYADGVLLRTITGVPAGTWFPAASILSNGSAGINGNPKYPVAGFSDWTTTL